MIALVILAVSLTALLGTQSQAMVTTHYIRNVTIASMLTRSKMTELEGTYRKEGFGSFDEEDGGDFGDEGFGDFEWKIELTKIEADEAALEGLTAQTPTDMEQITGKLMENAPFEGFDMGGLNFNPGMIMSALPMLLEQLGEKVRKVTFEVSWPEGRKGRRSMSVNTFFVLFEEVQPQVDTSEPDDEETTDGKTTTPESEKK